MHPLMATRGAAVAALGVAAGTRRRPKHCREQQSHPGEGGVIRRSPGGGAAVAIHGADIEAAHVKPTSD